MMRDDDDDDDDVDVGGASCNPIIKFIIMSYNYQYDTLYVFCFILLYFYTLLFFFYSRVYFFFQYLLLLNLSPFKTVWLRVCERVLFAAYLEAMHR